MLVKVFLLWWLKWWWWCGCCGLFTIESFCSSNVFGLFRSSIFGIIFVFFIGQMFVICFCVCLIAICFWSLFVWFLRYFFVFLVCCAAFYWFFSLSLSLSLSISLSLSLSLSLLYLIYCLFVLVCFWKLFSGLIFLFFAIKKNFRLGNVISSPWLVLSGTKGK